MFNATHWEKLAQDSQISLKEIDKSIKKISFTSDYSVQKDESGIPKKAKIKKLNDIVYQGQQNAKQGQQRMLIMSSMCLIVYQSCPYKPSHTY